MAKSHHLIGRLMPHFTLPCSDGTTVDSRDLLGKGTVVLFFYPRDHTPGCTREACGFRDDHAAFEAVGARVFGVSRDGIDRHRSFVEAHELPFPLLSDPDRAAARAFGVKPVLGLLPSRETFVIDRAGVVRHHIRNNLAPERHVAEALDIARALDDADGASR